MRLRATQATFLGSNFALQASQTRYEHVGEIEAGWDLPLTLPKLNLDCQYDGNPDALERHASNLFAVNLALQALQSSCEHAGEKKLDGICR